MGLDTSEDLQAAITQQGWSDTAQGDLQIHPRLRGWHMWHPNTWLCTHMLLKVPTLLRYQSQE